MLAATALTAIASAAYHIHEVMVIIAFLVLSTVALVPHQMAKSILLQVFFP